MELSEALQVLAEAAAKWNAELADYIIPNASETSEEDAAGYTEESGRIDVALAVVVGKRLLPVPGTSPSTYSLVPDDADTADPPKICLTCGFEVEQFTPGGPWKHKNLDVRWPPDVGEFNG